MTFPKSFIRCFASSSTSKAGKIARLASQGVYKVTGPDTAKFLKGLTCKDVDRIGGGYTGFLNATGRVLHTNFIIPIKGASPPSYLITHAEEHPNPLSTLLPQFKLRSKVKLEDVSSNYAVWQAWGTEGQQAALQRSWKFGSGGAAEAVWEQDQVKSTDVGLEEGEHGCFDLRAGSSQDGLGRRLIVKRDEQPSILSDGSHQEVPETAYDQHRWHLGVPEGVTEVVPGSALPLESCMDIHGGADFRKGCYVGQELTVRTYMRGATHKRILPVQLFSLSNPSSPLPPTEAIDIETRQVDIAFHPGPESATKRAKSAGKLVSSGLALLRVEMARKACWSGVSKTVGEWLQDSARLTVDVDGVQHGIWVAKGEAYAAALEAAEREEEQRLAEEAAAEAEAEAEGQADAYEDEVEEPTKR